MFFKNYQILFLSTLVMGTMIAVSANSWFTSWLGLEINLMSMIPLMLSELNSKMTEASIKYFLSQAMASILLIFSLGMKFTQQETLNLESLEIILISSLLMKAGLAPFHFWFPQVAMFLNWFQCLLIFTWQKIAPLILLSTLNLKLALITSALSAVIGALGGLNQKTIKLILTYSSISHSAWMIMACVISFKTWFTYFSIYSFLSFAIILFFYLNQVNLISSIFSSEDTFFSKFILSFNLLSLGGLPPLLGFSAKLSIIMISLKLGFILIFSPLIISSLISLFFYFRVIYTNFMFSNSLPNIYFNLNKKTLSTTNSLSLFFNISSPLIFILL